MSQGLTLALKSAGRQTLDIVAEHAERFEVVALAAGSNLELLAEQIRAVKPKLVAIRHVLSPGLAELGADHNPSTRKGAVTGWARRLQSSRR